jgi:hypothetical protein
MPDAEHQLLNAQIDERLSNVTVYIIGAVVVSLVTSVIVAVVAILRPQSTQITTIVGITTPVSMALLAAGLQGIHKGINGRLSQLLHRTAQASHASGRAETIKQLYFRLAELSPGTTEYETLAAQLRKESMSYFEVVEKRTA